MVTLGEVFETFNPTEKEALYMILDTAIKPDVRGVYLSMSDEKKLVVATMISIVLNKEDL